MSRNLSNLFISESFQYLTQVSGSEIQTGLGATVSGSLLITASRADNATSASFADNANTATSSSFAENARSASYAETATSASYATFASGAVDVNAIYTASAEFSEITFEKGDASTFVVDSTPRRVIETVKNVTVSTINKGTPVYVSGSTGNALNVYPADASDVNRMPAAFVLNEQLIAGAEGEAILEGFINGVDTSTFAAGDDVYVAVGGGYTNVKPTGSANYIQKLGNVIQSSVNGSGVITTTGYYNDLPNIQSGYAWVGNSDGVATAIPTSSLSTTVDTGSLLTTASISDADITFTKGDASTFDITVNNVINSTSASFADNANTATTATTATSSSFADNANTAISASQSDNATSASFADIANTVTGIVTSASYAETASYANDFEVAGTITALSASITYIENVFETSSTIYSSGSNQFGDASDDIQTLYGTVDILTGPLNVSGSSIFHNGITGSLDGTASFVDNSTSSSFADTANTATTATNATSASFADTANTATTADSATSASYAVTASYAENAGDADPFPYTGSAIISGSLALVNNVQTALSLTNIGNTMLGTTSNTINNSSGVTIIGNGSQIDNSSYSLVVGERNKSKAGTYQFIAGGSDNNLETNSQGYSAIIASYNSNVHNAGGSNLYHAMVLGGTTSTANGNLTSTLSDDTSTVNGVRLSAIATKGSTVSGSEGSVAIATLNSTANGASNSIVIGGKSHTVAGSGSVIIGGQSATVSVGSNNTAIGSNTVSVTGGNSGIYSSFDSDINNANTGIVIGSTTSDVVGGNDANNGIYSSKEADINVNGAQANFIGGTYLGAIRNFAPSGKARFAYSTILGGESNGIHDGNNSGNQGSNYASFVVGGAHNTVKGYYVDGNENYSSGILASTGSTVTATSQSAILGGEYNLISGSNNTVILGGVGITGSADNTVYVPNLNVSGSATGLVANTADTYATPDIEQVITLT